MVVLRFIGDEWKWEERIALAVAPQRPFTMSTTHLVKKLGVDKWTGLVLYRTEGRPPKYCRPTVPLSMSSNPQREGLRDGSVLWVRVDLSAAQQERDRAFQRSLDAWRAGHGIRGVEDDGGDVRRFLSQLSSALSADAADAVAADEREARDAIEGDEHRRFTHMTGAVTARERIGAAEGVARQRVETAAVAAAERIRRAAATARGDAAERTERRTLEAAESNARDALEQMARRSHSDRTAAKPETPPLAHAMTNEAPPLAHAMAQEVVAAVRAEARRLLQPLETRCEDAADALRAAHRAAARDTAVVSARAKAVVAAAARSALSLPARDDTTPAADAWEGMRALLAALEAQRALLRLAARPNARSEAPLALSAAEAALRAVAACTKPLSAKARRVALGDASRQPNAAARAVLVAFVARRVPSDAEFFVDDLVRRSGGVRAAADEICWAFAICSHPLRRRFVTALEDGAPHLCAVVDVLLELYAGREAELMLAVRPEWGAAGHFVACESGEQSFYYHTAIDMSQWERPVTI